MAREFNISMALCLVHLKALVQGAPQTLRQWPAIPENSLATAVNDEVFHDPAEKFTAIRKTLIEYHPEDVRLKKNCSLMHDCRAGRAV